MRPIARCLLSKMVIVYSYLIEADESLNLNDLIFLEPILKSTYMASDIYKNLVIHYFWVFWLMCIWTFFFQRSWHVQEMWKSEDDSMQKMQRSWINQRRLPVWSNSTGWLEATIFFMHKLSRPRSFFLPWVLQIISLMVLGSC